MLHIEELEAPQNLLIRGFTKDKKYGDEYTAEMVLSIYPSLFIEVHGLRGSVPRSLYIEGIKYLRKLSDEYNIPVVAERMGAHKLPFFELIQDWWFLK